jgi:hypothetical protein
MAYCVYVEIKSLTGTELDSAVIEEIIEQADNEINALIYASGLTPPTSDSILKAASEKLSVIGIITRHRMDGTMPSSLSLGGLSMSDNLDAAIKDLRTSANVLVQSYITKNSTAMVSGQSTRVYVVNKWR